MSLPETKKDGPHALPIATVVSMVVWIYLCECLIQDGNADVTLKANDGATVLRFVCHLGYMGIVRYLHRVSALFRASSEGHLEIVQYLIKDCHIDAAVKVANAGTALHGASHFSTLSCCTVFDSRMPSQCISTKAGCGVTPFHCASRSGHFGHCTIFHYRLSYRYEYNAYAW